MLTDKSLKEFLADMGMILYIYRIGRKSTIEGASYAANISPALLCKIEKGDILNLRVGVLFELCKYYGIDHWIAFI